MTRLLFFLFLGICSAHISIEYDCGGPGECQHQAEPTGPAKKSLWHEINFKRTKNHADAVDLEGACFGDYFSEFVTFASQSKENAMRAQGETKRSVRWDVLSSNATSTPCIGPYPGWRGCLVLRLLRPTIGVQFALHNFRKGSDIRVYANDQLTLLDRRVSEHGREYSSVSILNNRDWSKFRYNDALLIDEVAQKNSIGRIDICQGEVADNANPKLNWSLFDFSFLVSPGDEAYVSLREEKWNADEKESMADPDAFQRKTIVLYK